MMSRTQELALLCDHMKDNWVRNSNLINRKVQILVNFASGSKEYVASA